MVSSLTPDMIPRLLCFPEERNDIQTIFVFACIAPQTWTLPIDTNLYKEADVARGTLIATGRLYSGCHGGNVFCLRSFLVKLRPTM